MGVKILQNRKWNQIVGCCFLEHLTQLLRLGCYYGFGGRKEKKQNCFKNGPMNLGKKTGRYTKRNIDLQKKILKNLQRCAWAGGVDDVTLLSVKSQVFRTSFAYSQLFRRTNNCADGCVCGKDLSGHFAI